MSKADVTECVSKNDLPLMPERLTTCIYRTP